MPGLVGHRAANAVMGLGIVFWLYRTNRAEKVARTAGLLTGDGLTKNRPAMARAFITLSQDDLDDPNPPVWVKFWLEDPPPLGERIRNALSGQPDQWP